MDNHQIRLFLSLVAILLLTSCTDDKNPVQQYGNRIKDLTKAPRSLTPK